MSPIYYEAYNERYKKVHEEGIQWFCSESSPIVADIIAKYNIQPHMHLLELGCGEGRDAQNTTGLLMSLDHPLDTGTNFRDVFATVDFPTKIFFCLFFFGHLPALSAHVGKDHIVAIPDIFLKSQGAAGADALNEVPKIGEADGFLGLDDGVIVIQNQAAIF